MPKTEILTRLENKRKDFVGGLDKLKKQTETFAVELHKGPPELAVWEKAFKKTFDDTNEHLKGMHVAIDDFQKKWQSWQNPSLKSAIKNAFQFKKLAKDRETATAKYVELTKDYDTLNKSWTDIKQWAERYEIF